RHRSSRSGSSITFTRRRRKIPRHRRSRWRRRRNQKGRPGVTIAAANLALGGKTDREKDPDRHSGSGCRGLRCWQRLRQLVPEGDQGDAGIRGDDEGGRPQGEGGRRQARRGAEAPRRWEACGLAEAGERGSCGPQEVATTTWARRGRSTTASRRQPRPVVAAGPAQRSFSAVLATVG